jgi:hypothetical protein
MAVLVAVIELLVLGMLGRVEICGIEGGKSAPQLG